MSIVMSAIKSMFEGKVGGRPLGPWQPMASLCDVFLTNQEPGNSRTPPHKCCNAGRREQDFYIYPEWIITACSHVKRQKWGNVCFIRAGEMCSKTLHKYDHKNGRAWCGKRNKYLSISNNFCIMLYCINFIDFFLTLNRPQNLFYVWDHCTGYT